LAGWPEDFPLRIVSFHTLNTDQTLALAELHFQIMPGLLSRLGLDFTRQYYQAAQAQPTSLGVAALSADGTPLGWAVGSSQPARLTSRLRGAALREALLRPNLLLPLLVGGAASWFAPNDLPPGGVELTYLGVSAQARGKGLGAALLQDFLQAAQAPVALSVETNNLAALRLYQRFGFSVTRTFWEFPYHRHRMLKVRD